MQILSFLKPEKKKGIKLPLNENGRISGLCSVGFRSDWHLPTLWKWKVNSMFNSYWLKLMCISKDWKIVHVSHSTIARPQVIHAGTTMGLRRCPCIQKLMSISTNDTAFLYADLCYSVCVSWAIYSLEGWCCHWLAEEEKQDEKSQKPNDTAMWGLVKVNLQSDSRLLVFTPLCSTPSNRIGLTWVANSRVRVKVCGSSG